VAALRQVHEKKQPLLSELSRRRKLKMLAEQLPAKSTVLEIGCGDGWFTRGLRALGYEVTSADLTPPADVVGDITRWRELGLAPHSFDAVIALEVIEHVDCIEAMTGLAREDGLIMLSSPEPKWDWAMQVLEFLRLTQKRTSPHNNLTRFEDIPLQPVLLKRQAIIHQVGIFRNRAKG